MPAVQTLSQLAQGGRDNNLNAIRLLLAAVVLFSHCFPLTSGLEADPLSWLRHDSATLGSLAVDLFFFISGMLVTASWLNCKSMNDYLRRRILRIVPGYLCGLAVGFFVALIFAEHPLADLHSRLGNFRNSLALGIGGVQGDWIFPHNPFTHIANGSLWTIRPEFDCYLLVAGIGLACCFQFRRLLLAAGLAVTAWYLHRHFPSEHSPWRFFSIFLTGACVRLWRDKIPVHAGIAAVALAVFIAAIFWSPFGMFLMTLSACYLVLWAGYGVRIPCLSWCNRTDLSYGTYLYAFPVQQVIAAAGVTNPWVMFAAAMPPVLVLALASWRFVEKPALRFKSRNILDRDPALAAPAN